MTLRPFIDGLRSAGADVLEVCVSDLSIKPCLGCFSCWLRTPGRCIHRDAMDNVLGEMCRELLVLATPVYVDGMTGPLKTMLDRIIPLAEPWIEIRDDHCRHPHREPSPGIRRIALLSVSGFYELDNFDPLVCHVKAVAKNLARQYSGSLLRPYAGALPFLKASGIDVDDVYLALRQAGEHLVIEGTIPRHIEDRVSRHLLTRDQYVEGLNKTFAAQLKAYAAEHEATLAEK